MTNRRMWANNMTIITYNEMEVTVTKTAKSITEYIKKLIMIAIEVLHMKVKRLSIVVALFQG